MKNNLKTLPFIPKKDEASGKMPKKSPLPKFLECSSLKEDGDDVFILHTKKPQCLAMVMPFGVAIEIVRWYDEPVMNEEQREAIIAEMQTWWDKNMKELEG